MLHKALSAVAGVEMHHEYMVQVTQPLAVRRYHGLVDDKECARLIADTYGAAVKYSDKAHWGDSSNKLSWLIPDLAAAFPEARFVHLVRDGRKVASSYFHKLGEECYDDRSTTILKSYLDGAAPAPPPEKKYWWPQNPAFAGFDQFQRIAWHWAEINRVIVAETTKLPPERTLFVRLEDLRASPALARSLYEFLGLAWRDRDFASFARPHNVNRPEDKLLDPAQSAQFEAIAAPMMERLGYAGRPEYVMNY